MATVNLLPNAEGTTQQWDTVPVEFPTPIHWTKVDDPVGKPDEDATYVGTGVPNEIEEFNHETSDLLTGVTITNVRVTARMRGNTTNPAYVNIGLNIGGTRYSAATNESLTIFYTDYYKDWATSPAGVPGDWTKNDIDGLQTSLKAINVGGLYSNARCTQIYITVTYTPVVAVPRKPRMGATVGLPHII